MPLEWPDGEDVLNRLRKSRLIELGEDPPYLGLWPEAALELFEQTTGRLPFLASSVETSLYYNAPGTMPRGSFGRHSLGAGKVLLLDPCFVSVSSVAIGVSASDDAGQVLLNNRDYFLRPENRLIKRKPVEWIEFFMPIFSGPRGVKVTGKPGYSLTVTPLAYETVMAGACFMAGSDILGGGTSGGLAEWKEGDATERFGDVLGQIIDGFGRSWKVGLASFMRRVIV